MLAKASPRCNCPHAIHLRSPVKLIVNQRAFDALPDDLRGIVGVTAQSVNDDLLALYSARNPQALDTLANREQTEFRELPADVLRALKQASEQVLTELAARDEFTRRVYDSWLAFREQSRQWHRLSERAFLEARD